MGKNRKDDVETHHTGGLSSEDPSYSKPKQGDISWIPAFDEKQIRMFFFLWNMSSPLYLSKKEYPDEKLRRIAYSHALAQAGVKGKNYEMVGDIELWHESGYFCEKLVEKLKEKYMPTVVLQKKKVVQEFFAFQRDGSKLSEAVRKLSSKVLECRQVDYKPDEETIALKYESLLLPAEVPMYQVYLNQTDEIEGQSRAERVRFVMETFARDKEGPEKKQQKELFCGSAHAEKDKSGRNPKRLGYRSNKGNEKHGNGPECSYCGDKNCKALQSKKKEDCKAHGKTCGKCGLKHHLTHVCKTSNYKKKNGFVKSRANAATGEEDHHDEDTKTSLCSF